MGIKSTVKNNDVLDELLKKYNLELVLEPMKEKKKQEKEKTQKEEKN